MEDGIRIVYQAVRDKRVAEAVLAAGTGLVAAFIVLYLGYGTIESIALVVGFPAVFVGIVACVEVSRDVEVAEKKTGVTWEGLEDKTWDDLKNATWDELGERTGDE